MVLVLVWMNVVRVVLFRLLWVGKIGVLCYGLNVGWVRICWDSWVYLIIICRLWLFVLLR